MSTSVASDVLGTFGAVFWSIQLIPQIWVNYRRPNHTEGLQPSMMLLWAAAGIPLGIYNILSSKSIALQIQPQILTALSLVTWGQVYYYGHKWSLAKTVLVTTLLGFFAAGVELAGILPFLLSHSGGNGSEQHAAPEGYLLAMAILSAVGLGLGVLRHYWDIYIHRSVRGISFLFVFLDAAGDLTSLLSVVLVRPVDVEGATIYAVELALWIGIMLAGVAYNLRAWLHGKRGSHLTGEGVQAEIDAQEEEASPTSGAVSNLERTSSSASSVFRTVGLRQRAIQMLHLRRQEVGTAAA